MLKSIFFSAPPCLRFAMPAFAQAKSTCTVPTKPSSSAPPAWPRPLDQVASSVTVITAADIEARQERSLPDVLADVPGLFVVQTGGVGGQTSIFMRGTNSNHTKVLLDGIDIADPSTPNDAADIGKLLHRRHRAGGSAARAAVGALRLRRHRRGDQHHHQERRGPADAHRPGRRRQLRHLQPATPRSSGSDGAFHYRAHARSCHAGATPVTPPTLLLPGEKRNDDFYDGVRPRPSWAMTSPTISIWALSAITATAWARSPATPSIRSPSPAFPSPTQTRIATLQYDSRATAHLVLGAGSTRRWASAITSAITSDADPNNGYSVNGPAHQARLAGQYRHR